MAHTERATPITKTDFFHDKFYFLLRAELNIDLSHSRVFVICCLYRAHRDEISCLHADRFEIKVNKKKRRWCT